MVAAMLLACFPVLADAADWELIEKTKLGQLKLDKSSLVFKEKLTQATLLYAYDEMQKAVPPIEAHDRRQDKLMFDCAEKSFGLTEREYFLGDKAIQTSLMQKIYFNHAPPDSLAEKMLKMVCDAAKQAGH
ncbi:MAG: hypothetical protein HY306_09785 [Nitrosomonadales bacterium]|nr:hypothetical protein [Nitrosomonadales bacterium]